MSTNSSGVGRSSIKSRIQQFEGNTQTNEVQPRPKTTTKGKVGSTSSPQVQEPPKPTVKQENFSQIPPEKVQKQTGGGTLEQVSQQVSQRPVERSTVRKKTSKPPSKTTTTQPQTGLQSSPPTPPPRTQTSPPPQTQTTQPQTGIPSTPPKPQTTTQSSPPPQTQTTQPQTGIPTTPPPPRPQTTTQSSPPTQTQTTQPQTGIPSTPPPTPQTSVQSTPQQGSVGVGSVSPPVLGPTDTGTLFNELKSEFPHLKTHFDSLAQQGVKVEVVRTDPSAGSGAYFNQDTNSIRVKDNGTLSRPALKDNVLYESFNAVAEKQYKALDKDLSSRKLSLPEYGDKKARAEAHVTINYVDTLLEGFKGDSKAEARSKLVELSKQVPLDLEAPGARETQNRLNREAAPLGLTEKALRATAWAERIAPGYLANPQTSKHKALEDNFVAAPHENNVPSTHRFSLSSANLYTYEGLERQTAGGLIGILQSPLKGQSSDQVTKIRNQISALRPSLERLDAMPETTPEEKNTKANAKAGAYENALQTIMRENPGFATKFQPIALSQGIKTFAGIP